MRWALILILSVEVVVLLLSIGYIEGENHSTSTAHLTVINQQTIPGDFNGRGAFTIGCQFWDPTILHPDQPPRGINTLSAGLAWGDSIDLLAFIDTPLGPAVFSGNNCGVGIDYNGIPGWSSSIHVMEPTR